jgi:hypothetical protein
VHDQQVKPKTNKEVHKYNQEHKHIYEGMTLTFLGKKHVMRVGNQKKKCEQDHELRRNLKSIASIHTKFQQQNFKTFE